MRLPSGAAIAVWAGVCVLQAVGGAAETDGTPTRPLLGVTRWDMYSGHHDITQKQEFGFLAPEEFRWRAPFFARRTGNPERPLAFNPDLSMEVLREAMDREIVFAASCGIDYWAFGHERKDRNFGLRYNLEAYLAGRLKAEIGFCVICNCPQVGNRKRWEPPDTQYDPADVRDEWEGYVAEYLELMAEESYQRVLGGRPLIYLYRPEGLAERLQDNAPGYSALADCVRHLRDRAQAAGLGDPYVVCMVHEADARDLLRAGIADAVTLYHYRFGPQGQDHPYAKLWPAIRAEVLETRFSGDDVPVVPPLMSGANWIPRVRVMPQVFPDWNWLEPEPGELGAHLRGGLDWVARHPGKCPASTVLMYAWNEHSEGGFLCPLMGEPPEYTPVTLQIDEVSATLKNWLPPSLREAEGEVLANYSFGDREPTLQSIARPEGCTAGELRLPPVAYFAPPGPGVPWRGGICLATYLQPDGEPQTLRFSLSPTRAGTKLQLSALRCALWLPAGHGPLELQAGVIQRGAGLQAAPPYAAVEGDGRQEAVWRLDEAAVPVAGEVTVEVTLPPSPEPVPVRLDDLRLTGRVVEAAG